MSLRHLFARKPLSTQPFLHLNPPQAPRLQPHQTIRHASTSTSSPPASVQKILNRLPKRLRPYAQPLLHAPKTHIVSFLILHELTAIIPLFGLAGLFHWLAWVPEGLLEGHGEFVEMFGRWFGRRGWFGFDRENVALGKEPIEVGKADGEKSLVEQTERKYGVGQRGGRILIEVAAAYAVTKVLLPVRILVSVWGTPWFARVVVGAFTKLGSVLRRR